MIHMWSRISACIRILGLNVHHVIFGLLTPGGHTSHRGRGMLLHAGPTTLAYYHSGSGRNCRGTSAYMRRSCSMMNMMNGVLMNASRNKLRRLLGLTRIGRGLRGRLLHIGRHSKGCKHFKKWGPCFRAQRLS